MNLKYNANVICAAEKALNKRFVEILEELESKEGASLSTLRALLAAGVSGAQYPGGMFDFIDTARAGSLIDQHGVDVIAADIGKALRGYFARGSE